MIEIPIENKFYANVEFIHFEKLLEDGTSILYRINFFERDTKLPLAEYFIPDIKRKGNTIKLETPCGSCKKDIYAILTFENKNDAKTAEKILSRKKNYIQLIEQLIDKYDRYLAECQNTLAIWKAHDSYRVGGET